jgi:hypothetical protein
MRDLLDDLLIALPKLPEIPVSESAALSMRRTPGLCAAIDRRPEELVHRKCALCTSEARLIVVVEPTILVSYRMRWLDVCHPCYRGVHILADNWPGDDWVMKRYAQLEELGLIAT